MQIFDVCDRYLGEGISKSVCGQYDLWLLIYCRALGKYTELVIWTVMNLVLVIHWIFTDYLIY